MFADFSITNAEGEVRDCWTLGTKAGSQTLEARAVDPTTGEQLVFAVVHANATPSYGFDMSVENVNVPVALGDSVDVQPYIVNVVDRFDNVVPDSLYALQTRIDNTMISGGPVTDWTSSPYVTITQAGDQLVWLKADSVSHFFHVTRAE